MMPFSRALPIELFSQETLDRNRWFIDMLQLWQPPGDALHPGSKESNQGLRLSIRAGYLNFYRAGQAIAKVSFSNGALKATIHTKYVIGNGAPNAQTNATLGPHGVCLHGSERWQPYCGIDELRRWISNANEYGGSEKRFVDRVVSQNPNIIDLEMALPAYGDNKNAPRMDLVNLEPNGDRWKIVFWEAKGVEDGRARTSGHRPEVVAQVKQYTDWLSDPGRLNSVATAYQSTCRLIVKFWELAIKINPDIPPLGSGIQSVANAVNGAAVDTEPRILIDARDGDGSFVLNGHLAKLQQHGLHVQMIRADEPMTLATINPAASRSF